MDPLTFSPVIIAGISSLKRKSKILAILITEKIVNPQYLTQQQLQQCKIHKYVAVDPNPLNTEFAMPLMDKLVDKLPLWLSPNAMTLSTLALSFLPYLLTAYYDWEILASSDDYPEYHPIPPWVWLVSSLCITIGSISDVIDGKQARRIGACTPVGELLDHGTDSWRLGVPLLSLHFSVFGRGDFGISARRQLYLLLGTQAVVLGSFWLQNLCGVLYYTVSSDLAQYLSIWFFLHTYFRNGAGWWQCEALVYGTNAAVVEGFIYVCIIGISGLQLLIFFARFLKNIKEFRTEENYSLQQHALSICTSPMALAATVLMWTICSDIIDLEPRIFLWTVGIVASDIMWSIFVNTISKSSPSSMNLTVKLYICSFLISQCLRAQEESILKLLASTVTAIHIHRTVMMLCQMCQFLEIPFFNVNKKKYM